MYVDIYSWFLEQNHAQAQKPPKEVTAESDGASSHLTARFFGYFKMLVPSCTCLQVVKTHVDRKVGHHQYYAMIWSYHIR